MDDKDVTIAQLQDENHLFREQVQLLKDEITSLRDEIARLKKNSGNSSKPPSSDIVKPSKPKGRGIRKRKRGGQKGHKKFERPSFPPQEIDQIIEYELRDQDAQGLIPLDQWQVVQQVELVTKPFLVTEHRARKYRDPKTGQMIITPLPDAVKQGGLLGPKLTAMVAYQKGDCHMTYSTIQRFLKDVIGLSVSRGQLAKVVGKVSNALQLPYEALSGALPEQPQLGIDETGHKDSGQLMWTWCFLAEAFTVFHLHPSRGSRVLQKVLGKTFGGTIGCDYYGAYRKYVREGDVRVQYCLAHLIREIRFLANHSNRRLSRWGQKLLEGLKKLFDTLHRRETLTPKGFVRSMERIRQRFLQTMRRPPDHAEAKKLAKRFRGAQAQSYFTFLTEPGVEPTNNATERAIRQVVIDRRVTQGTRGNRGQRWSERIWTILATCRQQNRSAFEFIYQATISHWTHQPCPSLLPQGL